MASDFFPEMVRIGQKDVGGQRPSRWIFVGIFTVAAQPPHVGVKNKKFGGDRSERGEGGVKRNFLVR